MDVTGIQLKLSEIKGALFRKGYTSSVAELTVSQGSARIWVRWNISGRSVYDADAKHEIFYFDDDYMRAVDDAFKHIHAIPSVEDHERAIRALDLALAEMNSLGISLTDTQTNLLEVMRGAV